MWAFALNFALVTHNLTPHHSILFEIPFEKLTSRKCTIKYNVRVIRYNIKVSRIRGNYTRFYISKWRCTYFVRITSNQKNISTYGYIWYSGIPVTSCFAGCIVSEPTLLFVITLNKITNQCDQRQKYWKKICFLQNTSMLSIFQKHWYIVVNINVSPNTTFWTSVLAAKWRPCNSFLTSGNSQKAQGVRSGEYAGCATTTIFYRPKTLWQRIRSFQWLN